MFSMPATLNIWSRVKTIRYTLLQHQNMYKDLLGKITRHQNLPIDLDQNTYRPPTMGTIVFMSGAGRMVTSH
jgi:hypothetical protein